jgi:hypothetical protein
MPRGAFLGTSFSGCFQLYNGIWKKSNKVGEDFFYLHGDVGSITIPAHAEARQALLL